MIRKAIANNLGLLLQDKVKGTKILSTREHLFKTQFLSQEELNNYQLKKIKLLVKHAVENVPYYQKLFKEEKIHPEDINSIEDYKKIPVLTKQIARENNDRLYAIAGMGKYKSWKTGGSTGPPLLLRKDLNTRTFTWGAYYRWYSWIGIQPGDSVITLWGAPYVLRKNWINNMHSSLVQYTHNHTIINSFSLNDATLPSTINLIRNKKPKLIKGYLSALLQVAEYMEENNINDIVPHAVSSTTETLFPHQRNYLEKIFQCHVYDQYGCGECGSIAFECKSHQGLHITMEHVFLEILGGEGEELSNDIGRIILTDLDNYAMPFIRYENGDLASFTPNYCTCGVNLPLLKSINGRMADTIILANSSKVHGVFFTDILYELNLKQNRFINRFQIFQSVPGEIQFRIETKNSLDETFKDLLKKTLEKFFNYVEIAEFRTLPTGKSGKFRYILSEIN